MIFSFILLSVVDAAGLPCSPAALEKSSRCVFFSSERLQERFPEHAASTLQESPGAAADRPRGVPARELAQLPPLHRGGRVSVRSQPPPTKMLLFVAAAADEGKAVSVQGCVCTGDQARSTLCTPPPLCPARLCRAQQVSELISTQPEGRSFCLFLAKIRRGHGHPHLFK